MDGWREDYFKNLFLPESAKYSVPNFPRILIFIGHASHISLKLAQMAEENNVKLLRLPSQLTHILQPLDKAVFWEVKRQWRKKLLCHARVSRDKIRREDLPAKISEVLETSLKSQNLRSEFEATGIFPCNRNRVKSQITEVYTPYAEAVTDSSESVPTLHQPPEPTTDQSTTKSLQTNRSVSPLQTLPVNSMWIPCLRLFWVWKQSMDQTFST